MCSRASRPIAAGGPPRSLIYLKEGPQMLTNKFPPRCALIATVAAVCLALAPTALAAKGGGAGKGGGGTGGGSITLVLVNSTDGLAHWGAQVTFNISTT